MRKNAMAIMAAILMGGLPVSAALAADQHGAHHHTRYHHDRAGASAHVPANPTVRDGYIMNGNFDWRRRGAHVPWYGHGYNDDCVAWTKHAYHYACDPNSRY